MTQETLARMAPPGPTPTPRATSSPHESSDARVPSAFAADVAMAAALWKRDMIRLVRERSRTLSVILPPLMFWLVIGTGMTDGFSIGEGAGSYRTFFFPGVLVMVVLFTTIFATMGVIEDRASGFLQQVLVAPGSRLAMVLGKVSGVTTVALIQVGLCLPLGALAGVGLGATSWPLLLLFLVLTAVGLTALSFAMAWLINSTHGYHGVMMALLLPLWMLSGAMFPPGGGVMEIIMRANPMTYMVDGSRHALMGDGLAPLGLDLGVCAGFAVATLALASWVTSRNREVRS